MRRKDTRSESYYSYNSATSESSYQSETSTVPSESSVYSEYAAEQPAEAKSYFNPVAMPKLRWDQYMEDVGKDCHHFKVLMWKHGIVRKRKFFKTFIEFTAPCFFFIIMFFVIPYLLKETESNTQGEKKTSLRSFSVPLETIPGPRILLYHPVNKVTDQLIDEVGKKLGLKRTRSIPIGANSTVYYGYPKDLTPLVYYLAKMTDGSAIVEFEGMDEDIWPKRLIYSIKMKHERDHIADGDYSQFMRLQWAIDSSYIGIMSRNSKDESTSSSAHYLPPVYLSEVPMTTELPSKSAGVAIYLANIMLRTVCPLSTLLPFIFLATRLMEERGSGVQELLCQAGVSYSVLAHAHGCNTIPSGLIFATCGVLVIKLSTLSWMPLSNPVLIFLALQLHFHSVTTWAFLVSFVNKSGDYSTTLALSFFILLYVGARIVSLKKLTTGLRMLSGLLPHVPLVYILQEVMILELTGKGMSMANITKSHTSMSISTALSLLSMCIQIVLVLIISKYLNDIRPGKYGTRKSCSYIFKKKEKVSPTALEEIENEKLKRDPNYFEDAKLDNVGIHIENVSKIFYKNIVLSNVSFDVYHGEITVLLGHNGAGKTTLLSIISGTLLPTKGRVLVHGHNIAEEKSKVQSMIGICPQHNIFFPDLTVKEHVNLFAMLRGSPYSAANISSQELLDKLKLGDKGNYKAEQLSGGMKRRLQLACALAGDCTVLILDEPTSGLDVETRRELWNLLLTLRGDRTVLLTTHFMEEADALGDRVAALHGGRLRCHATPMYLKKNIGTGYRLTLTTIESVPKEKEITSTIQRAVPNATVKETSLHAISYNLPSQDSGNFPAMFKALEKNKTKLGIQSIGVGATSLEEVFLKLCSDTETKFTEDNVDTKLSEPQYSRIKGWRLYMRQVRVLIKRQLRFIWHKKYSFLAMQVLLPILVMIAVAWLFLKKHEEPGDKPQSALSLDLHDVVSERNKSTLLVRAAPDLKEDVERLARYYDNVKFEFTNNVADKLFRSSEPNTNSTDYNLGIDLHDISAEVFYTTPYRRIAPVVINLLSNILAAHQRPSYEGRTITTNFEPMQYDPTPLSSEVPILNQPLGIDSAAMYVIIWMMFFVGVIVNAVALPVIERETGTRHIHLMAGVPPAVHWLTTLLTHTVLYSLVLLLPTMFLFFLEEFQTFNQVAFWGSYFLVMLMSLLAILSLCYLASFSLSKRGVSVFMIFGTLIFGVLPAGIITIARRLGPTQAEVKLVKMYPIFFCYYTLPMTTAIVAYIKVMDTARKNALCNNNQDKCPDVLVSIMQVPEMREYGFDAAKCCSEKKGTMCYLCIGEFSVGKELIILAAQTIFYFTLVVLAQYGMFNGLFDRIFNKGYKPGVDESKDNNIITEKNYVTEQMNSHRKVRDGSGDAMLLDGVHKKYVRLCSRSVNAVKGISFSVKKGECFGLLGVNGAGKSSTFKMMIAEEVATRGSIYANGYILTWPRSSEYLQSLSYCPQFFGLDSFETGQNNLTTLLTMRGLNSTDARNEANSWIGVVGLERYRNSLVEGYSGGCERRLATAAALSSGAPLTLLDEPTSGVDVSARRRVWIALRKGLRQNRAVIITSHSMDEMEALCERIVIMAAGKAAALGSAPALRAAYASGHSLAIKVSAASPEDIARLKDTIENTFSCTLVDEHATMLQYHINVPMQYSELFSTLEKLKKSFRPDIIEDYSISETTLEEVFLSIAKKKYQTTKV